MFNPENKGGISFVNDSAEFLEFPENSSPEMERTNPPSKSKRPKNSTSGLKRLAGALAGIVGAIAVPCSIWEI